MNTIHSKKHTYHFNQDNYYTKPLSSEAKRRRTFYEEPNQRLELSRRKKQIMADGRCIQIQRENRLLLSKITDIMSKPRSCSTVLHQQRQKGSLHSTYKKRQWQKIEIENSKILKRIMQQKSHYDYSRPTQKIQINKRIITRKIMPRSQKINISTNETPSIVSLQRMVNLNGRMLFIKVELSMNSLIIEGRTQTGEVKVIQIQRLEALDFIESECNNKIQNIFDRLTYEEGTLYLIGQQHPKNSSKVQNPDQNNRQASLQIDQYNHIQPSSQLQQVQKDNKQQFLQENDQVHQE